MCVHFSWTSQYPILFNEDIGYLAHPFPFICIPPANLKVVEYTEEDIHLWALEAVEMSNTRGLDSRLLKNS